MGLMETNQRLQRSEDAGAYEAARIFYYKGLENELRYIEDAVFDKSFPNPNPVFVSVFVSFRCSSLDRHLVVSSPLIRRLSTPLLVWLVVLTVTSSLSNEYTSQSFLLNGMAVGFASNVDDMISFCVIREVERKRVEEVVEELLHGREGDGGDKGFRRNRLYGALLAATLVVAVVYCEELMPYFGDEEGGIGRAPCSDISHVPVVMSYCVVWMVLLVMAGFNERNTTWCARLSDALLGSLVLFSGSSVVDRFQIVLHFWVAA